MSERELRRRSLGEDGYAFVCRMCHASDTSAAQKIPHLLDCPIADEPDVVKVLRWLDQEIRRLEELTQSGFFRLTIRALANVKLHIEREFAVHLTDDRWEWVEDE